MEADEVTKPCSSSSRGSGGERGATNEKAFSKTVITHAGVLRRPPTPDRDSCDTKEKIHFEASLVKDEEENTGLGLHIPKLTPLSG